MAVSYDSRIGYRLLCCRDQRVVHVRDSNDSVRRRACDRSVLVNPTRQFVTMVYDLVVDHLRNGQPADLRPSTTSFGRLPRNVSTLVLACHAVSAGQCRRSSGTPRFGCSCCFLFYRQVVVARWLGSDYCQADRAHCVSRARMYRSPPIKRSFGRGSVRMVCLCRRYPDATASGPIGSRF